MSPVMLCRMAVLAMLPMLFAAGALAAQLPDAPYEETPPEIVERMLQVAELRPGDVVYDLGCGDGRIVIAAVRRFGVRGVCVELDPARLKWAREVAEKAGVSSLIRFVEGDLFEVPLQDATVSPCTCYGRRTCVFARSCCARCVPARVWCLSGSTWATGRRSGRSGWAIRPARSIGGRSRSRRRSAEGSRAASEQEPTLKTQAIFAFASSGGQAHGVPAVEEAHPHTATHRRMPLARRVGKHEDTPAVGQAENTHVGGHEEVGPEEP